LVECFGEERVQAQKPLTVSEDFSGYLQKAPGAFFRVGAGNAAKGHVHPHHHPLFSIDENASPIGVQALVNVVFKVLDC
jgi:amidohydrolase